MAIRIERKTTLTLSGMSVTVEEFAKVLAEFPAGATIHFIHHKGYDQRDCEYLTIEVRMPQPTTLNPGTR